MSNMAGSPGSRPLEQLKVTELRDELKKRGLSNKGVKKELLERLEEAVKKEEQQENVVGEHEEVAQEVKDKCDTPDEIKVFEEETEVLERSGGEVSKCDESVTPCQSKASTDTPLPTTEESTPFSEDVHLSPAVSVPNEAPGSSEEREQLGTAGVENVEKNNVVVSVDDAVCGKVDATLVPEDVANAAGVLEPGEDISLVKHVESGIDEIKHGFVESELERMDVLAESGVPSSVLENLVKDVSVQPVSAIDITAPAVIEPIEIDCPMPDVECSNLKEDELLIADSATKNSFSNADDDMSLVQPCTQALDAGKPVESSHEVPVGGLKLESLSSQLTESPKVHEPNTGLQSEDLEKAEIDERDSFMNEEKSDVKLEVASKQEIGSEDGLVNSASPLTISEEKSSVKVKVASEYEIVSEDGLEKSAVKLGPVEIETCAEERYKATCEVKMETEIMEEGTQRESPSPQPLLEEVKPEHAYVQNSRGEENSHSVPDDRSKEGATSETADEDSQARVNLKRKDNELEAKQEPAKRMRRWNSGKEVVVETVKPLTTDSMKEIMLPESIEGSVAVTPRSTPKSVATSRALPPLVKVEPEPINSTRTVPPSTRAPTNSLKIDRFVRPFTLKAVKDLLAKFGHCIDFWMDQIKTHCYVTYSSIDEAVAARSGLYGRQWPPLVGNYLVAEFADSNEVKFRSEGLGEKAQVAPMTASVRVSNSSQLPSPRRGHTSLSFRSDPNLTPSRFSRDVQPSPLPKKDPEPAVVTLEDLFFKTKAKPHIYYLPLTDEQVAEKIKKKQAVRL